ncbi:villin-2-like isoform X2 [Curcuma longa]|uniref:villin-2-like isoform X2 n=1 Tax=Curcuma longa TaxID=136217 RepID=UPI003D9EDC47
MTNSTKNVDPAFEGAGQKLGMEIWRIKNFEPVALPKSDYGKFFSGDSYIILQTTSNKGGGYLYDIHFWIGKESSQDEAGTAAMKTVELDAVLGGRAVQHREIQGFESDKFLSYFKPCIIPLEGGFASGFKTPEEEKFETRLYICRGKRVVRMKLVPFARSSLNHDDVFILDTENKIYQFNGANSNIQERAKALEVVQYLKDKYHEGKCDVAIIDDGNLQTESDSGEFWVLFGGFAPIGKKVVHEDDVFIETTPGRLYSINDGELNLEECVLSKSILEHNKCYLLDCGAEIITWVGRMTQVEERKAASKAAEDFIVNENRPKTARITQVVQGHETHLFKSNFESWPAGTGTSSSEDGRGKVAALIKQQGVDFKGASKGSPVNEEIPPLLEDSGKLEVWLINGDAKEPVPKEEIGKFYAGDCYIVLYAYHSGEKKEDYFLTCWMGKDSTQDDQFVALEMANKIWNSLKGRPVQGCIFEGKEPPQFIALFHPMVVLKGGISSGYKSLIAEKDLSDETYSPGGIALIQVSGTSAHNSKGMQVEAVATSLNSYDCFVLQSGNTVFIRNGSSSTFEQQQRAVRTAEFLKPGATFKHCKEGTESSAFWFALGGKQNFSSKKATQDVVRDPHLYTFLFKKGKLEVTEVFNYSQDDLLTEDMLILDTHAEVFVWIGHSVDHIEKQNALDIGQKYIELAVSLEGLSPKVPLYKVTEGMEPCFFTVYFSWDPAKAMVQGNSFQKKLTNLFGMNDSEVRLLLFSHKSEVVMPFHIQNYVKLNISYCSYLYLCLQSKNRAAGVQHDGPTQRASALAALSSAFNPSPNTKSTVVRPSRASQGSQRAAAVAALSTVLTEEQKKAEEEAFAARFRSRSPGFTKTESEGSDSGQPEAMEGDDSEGDHNDEEESEVAQEDAEITENVGECTFNYECLKTKSSDPVRGIDYKRREAYLSDAEFESVLGMTKETFYQQPKWKQDLLKKKVDLF